MMKSQLSYKLIQKEKLRIFKKTRDQAKTLKNTPIKAMISKLSLMLNLRIPKKPVKVISKKKPLKTSRILMNKIFPFPRFKNQRK